MYLEDEDLYTSEEAREEVRRRIADKNYRAPAPPLFRPQLMTLDDLDALEALYSPRDF